MDKIDTNNNELNTEIIPEIKRVTLHPLTAEGETDLEVNLYPKTLLDGIVDREGKPVEVQEKLISGETIKTINGESVLGDGDIETVDAYAKEESDEKFLSKDAAAETYETIVAADEKFATKEEIPANYVTTDADQDIEGKKSFYQTITISNTNPNNGNALIDIYGADGVRNFLSFRPDFDGDAAYLALDSISCINLNWNNYGLCFPSTAEYTEDKTIATEDYVDDALSEIEIGLNGKTYKASGTTIELPDLAEMKEVIGNYPEYIDATVANGLAGKISWEDLQTSIDNGEVDFAAHTFNAYIFFDFPEVLDIYGLNSYNASGDPTIPGYISIYSNNPPVTMPDTVVDFPTLKAWIIANIGTLAGDSYVDETMFSSSINEEVYYNTENGMQDLNIAFKNGDIICEAHLTCTSGAGQPIVGATNPPKKPGVESTFVGEFRGDAYGGKIKCDSVDATTIRANDVGDEGHKVSTVYANNIGTAISRSDYIYSWNIGDVSHPVNSIYAGVLGSPSAKVKTVYADNIGYPTSKVKNVYANYIGVENNKVNYIYSNNIGSATSKIGSMYVNNIGSQNVPVNIFYCNYVGTSSAPIKNLYATNVVLNLPTSDPRVAGALWNDGGVLKISAGQPQA